MKKTPVASTLLKRPAAAAACGGRPPFVIGNVDNIPKVVHYNGGKIYTSWTKHAYRVILRTRLDAADTAVYWHKFDNQFAAAWAYACELIENDPRPL